MGTLEGFQPSFDPGGDPSGGDGAEAAARATRTGLPARVRLYGTTTSPYTRKVRVLARAAGLDVTLVDTRTEEGAAALARVAPLGKVPVVELLGPSGALDGDVPRVLPDSGLIAAWLWADHAATLRANGLAFAPDDWADRELAIAVEGALDAAINRFYLLRDKLPDQGYVTRQGDRVATTLAWLEARMPAFGLPLSASALSLGCALDWMAFRAVIDLARFPRLTAFRAAWAASGVGAGSEPG
jgi:glutathione S-transferase